MATAGRAGSEARPLPPDTKMAAGAAELRRLQWRLEELEQRVGLGGGGCAPRKVPGGAAEGGLGPFGAGRRGLGCRCPAGPDSAVPSLCASAGGGRAGEGAGGAEQYRRQEGEDQNSV